MDRIALTINEERYVAIPEADYQRLIGPSHTPAKGLAGTDAIAYIRQHMGSELRQARQHAKLTQNALAEALDVRQPTIANIEAGRDRVGERLIRRWLKACGLPMDWKPPHR
jgi:DNA-binding XRE family transcriptional regulator